MKHQTLAHHATDGSDERASSTTDISRDDFAHVFRQYPGGVAVITADSPDGPVALTATSVVSVSAEPPLLAFSISHRASTAASIRSAHSYVVHFLGKDQLDIAQLCATSGVDRFADTRLWARLDTGEPYFPSAPAWVAGTQVDQLDAGAASIILLRATQSAVAPHADGTPPLVYFNRGWHHLGEHSQVS
ncbi:flavin reductase family protein [Salinibacterium sp. PAMC 21357]|uniref:flavin reductase family protein n=1 Tax=Salinibacterium sp. PAMC 21357 TaxID=1112215 RepID=UPI00028894C3|nr:flavin reductase family protein [Salinibacterium sp. PAMC 21357]